MKAAASLLSGALFSHADAEATAEAAGDLPYEIEVKSDWASLLDPVPPEPELQQVGEHEVWQLTLFSPDECARLLQAAESFGFGKTSYPKRYRGNLRLITTDPGFAEAVWGRLQACVPAELSLEPDSDEVWDAYG